MRNTNRFILWAAIFFCLTLAGPLSGDADKTFIGEIGDSQCAMNVHSLDRSHKIMLKMGSAGKTAADCTRYCVEQRGGKFVLQTKTDVYKLGNQGLAARSAGLQVKVTGILDTETNTIQVRTIETIAPK